MRDGPLSEGPRAAATTRILGRRWQLCGITNSVDPAGLLGSLSFQVQPPRASRAIFRFPVMASVCVFLLHHSWFRSMPLQLLLCSSLSFLPFCSAPWAITMFSMVCIFGVAPLFICFTARFFSSFFHFRPPGGSCALLRCGCASCCSVLVIALTPLFALMRLHGVMDAPIFARRCRVRRCSALLRSERTCQPACDYIKPGSCPCLRAARRHHLHLTQLNRVPLCLAPVVRFCNSTERRGSLHRRRATH